MEGHKRRRVTMKKTLLIISILVTSHSIRADVFRDKNGKIKKIDANLIKPPIRIPDKTSPYYAIFDEAYQNAYSAAITEGSTPSEADQRGKEGGLAALFIHAKSTKNK